MTRGLCTCGCLLVGHFDTGLCTCGCVVSETHERCVRVGVMLVRHTNTVYVWVFIGEKHEGCVRVGVYW